MNPLQDNLTFTLAALSTLLADASSSFKSEVESKQSLIDQKHAKLRETSTLLAAERRRLNLLIRQATDRKGRAQRVVNLRAANEEQRTHLSRIANGTAGMDLDARQDITVGEADAGLEIDTQIVPFSPESRPPREFSPGLRNYLASLPPTAVLEARSVAYQRNNAHLKSQQKNLETRSTELESKLKRVLAISLECAEEELDQKIDGLLKAMNSEERENLGFFRVNKFLRRGKDRG